MEKSLSGVSTGVVTNLKQNAGEIEGMLGALASSTSEKIRAGAQDAERTLSNLSTGIVNALKQNSGEVEKTLTGVSAGAGDKLKHKTGEIETTPPPPAASPPAHKPS